MRSEELLCRLRLPIENISCLPYISFTVLPLLILLFLLMKKEFFLFLHSHYKANYTLFPINTLFFSAI